MSARAVSSRCCQCTASHARTYNSFIPLGIYISSLAAAAAEQSSRSIGENAVNRNIYIYKEYPLSRDRVETNSPPSQMKSIQKT